jgi:glycosyltransferase involved in cell wall biosynthesis/acyl-[acyl carrier protein]--UDP-N-acetylglucosamine O-acyltransferase
MPKVSVIIPTYNCAKYLPEAIESVLNQTYHDFEIIVVDDGSTDNTKEILSRYNGKIRYIYQENKGHSFARNLGIHNTTGEYIAFLDADDIWLPERIKEGIALLESNPDTGLVHSNVFFIYDGTSKKYCPRRNTKLLSGNIFKYLLMRKAHISSPTVLIKKECLVKTGLFDENLARLGSEDRDLWLRVTKEFNVKYLDKPLACYRVRQNSQSGNSEKMFQGKMHSLNKIFAQYKCSRLFQDRVYSAAYKDYGDELLLRNNFLPAASKYIKAISYWPFNYLSFLNFFKAICKTKVNIFSNLRADAKRYIGNPKGIRKVKMLVRLLFTQEFLAIAIFRFGKSIKRIKIPLVGFLLRAIYFLLNKIIAEICASILIDLDSEIGKGFQIGHFGGTHIKAKIGENCTVGQFVVIGYKGAYQGGGVPTLGDDVWVGTGAKILGEVKVGSNVFIGANAVVINDIPDNATAVGIPAGVVKIRETKTMEVKRQK